MTIERPMFPPRAGAKIIQLNFALASHTQAEKILDQGVSASVHQIPTKAELSRDGRPLPPALTEICRNQRARLKRRDVWRRAEHSTTYWRARCEWSSALQTAQLHGIGDAESFPQVMTGEAWEL